MRNLLALWRRPLFVLAVPTCCWTFVPATVTVTAGPATIGVAVVTSALSGCSWFGGEDHRADKIPVDDLMPPDPKNP